MLLLGKDYFEQDPPALPPEESCGLLGDGSEEDAVPCECPEKWYQKILPFLRRNRKGAIVAASVLVIGLGVYLNWYLYRTDVPAVKNEGEATEQSTAGEKDASKHTGFLGGWQSDDKNHWKAYSCCNAHAETADRL